MRKRGKNTMNKTQKSIVTRILMTFAIVFAMAIVSGISTKAAAPAQVTGVKQLDATSSAVAIQWNPVSGVDRYYVERATTVNGSYTRYTATSISGTLSGLSSGKSYWIRVCAVSGNETGAYSTPIEVVTAPSAPRSLKHVKSTGTTISLSWAAPSSGNTESYLVAYVKAGSSKVKYSKPIKTTSYKISGLSKNAEYDVAVIPTRTMPTNRAESVWGQIAEKYNVPVTPQKASSVKVTSFYDSQGKVYLKTNTMKSADGYQYELYTAYGKAKKIKTFTVNSRYPENSIKHKELKKNNFYKVKVRAFCKDSNGKKYYAPWSSYVYTSRQPAMNKTYQRVSGGIKIKWKKINGASRYVVYVSTKLNGKYNKVTTVKGTTAQVKKCGKSKLKSGKKYYVYVVAQKKVGKNYYNSNDSTAWGCVY
ncbi:MAG: fibronectin type III domain-containing protein [Lachnospiraceae bacterium]|nr:fibronectin type III domain-containing protein [Lachnospiraceae bacterium]